MPRIENWSIIADNSNPYLAPELRNGRLKGNIFDDELLRFKNNDLIITSLIIELNLKENYAQTENTKYILGKIDEKYVEFLK